ncbi:hypothetical protein LQT29_23650 (plasmid) [Escherichia coli]|nr:hypothetical protein LQT29_23650 [Escherichia coli]
MTTISRFLLQKRRERGKLLFPVSGVGQLRQREGVSYDVPVTADQPLLYSAILRSSAAVFWHRGF